MVRYKKILTPEASNIVRMVMAEKRISPTLLALKIDVSPSTLSRLLSGFGGHPKKCEQLYRVLDEDDRITFLKESDNNSAYYSIITLKVTKSTKKPVFFEDSLSPYFLKINELYKSNPHTDSRLKVMRSLDTIIYNLEREEIKHDN